MSFEDRVRGEGEGVHGEAGEAELLVDIGSGIGGGQEEGGEEAQGGKLGEVIVGGHFRYFGALGGGKAGGVGAAFEGGGGAGLSGGHGNPFDDEWAPERGRLKVRIFVLLILL